MDNRIVSMEAQIQLLIAEAKAAINNAVLTKELPKYLCVRAAGYLEESLRILLVNYTQQGNKMPQPIIRFVEHELDGIGNCKHEKILTILNRFSLQWESKYDTEVKKINSNYPDEIKDAVNSIVENRNRIAHGNSIGIGLVNIEKWFKQAQKAVEILDTIIQ